MNSAARVRHRHGVRDTTCLRKHIQSMLERVGPPLDAEAAAGLLQGRRRNTQHLRNVQSPSSAEDRVCACFDTYPVIRGIWLARPRGLNHSDTHPTDEHH
jgi:hypothetical protein